MGKYLTPENVTLLETMMPPTARFFWIKDEASCIDLISSLRRMEELYLSNQRKLDVLRSRVPTSDTIQNAINSSELTMLKTLRREAMANNTAVNDFCKSMELDINVITNLANYYNGYGLYILYWTNRCRFIASLASSLSDRYGIIINKLNTHIDKKQSELVIANYNTIQPSIKPISESDEYYKWGYNLYPGFSNTTSFLDTSRQVLEPKTDLCDYKFYRKHRLADLPIISESKINTYSKISVNFSDMCEYINTHTQKNIAHGVNSNNYFEIPIKEKVTYQFYIPERKLIHEYYDHIIWPLISRDIDMYKLALCQELQAYLMSHQYMIPLLMPLSRLRDTACYKSFRASAIWDHYNFNPLRELPNIDQEYIPAPVYNIICDVIPYTNIWGTHDIYRLSAGVNGKCIKLFYQFNDLYQKILADAYNIKANAYIDTSLVKSIECLGTGIKLGKTDSKCIINIIGSLQMHLMMTCFSIAFDVKNVKQLGSQLKWIFNKDKVTWTPTPKPIPLRRYSVINPKYFGPNGIDAEIVYTEVADGGDSMYKQIPKKVLQSALGWRADATPREELYYGDDYDDLWRDYSDDYYPGDIDPILYGDWDDEENDPRYYS